MTNSENSENSEKQPPSAGMIRLSPDIFKKYNKVKSDYAQMMGWSSISADKFTAILLQKWEQEPKQ